MKPITILKRARKLIENPANWTQDAFEESKHKYCPVSAISSVSHGDGNAAYNLFVRAVGQLHVGKWNDAPERTHPEVLAAFDAAIALAEKGAQS